MVSTCGLVSVRSSARLSLILSHPISLFTCLFSSPLCLLPSLSFYSFVCLSVSLSVFLSVSLPVCLAFPPAFSTISQATTENHAAKKQKKTSNYPHLPQHPHSGDRDHHNSDNDCRRRNSSSGETSTNGSSGWLQDAKTWNHDRVLKKKSSLPRTVDPESETAPGPTPEPAPGTALEAEFKPESTSVPESGSKPESTSEPEFESQPVSQPESDFKTKSKSEPEQTETPASWSLVQLIALQLEIRTREEYDDAMQVNFIPTIIMYLYDIIFLFILFVNDNHFFSP